MGWRACEHWTIRALGFSRGLLVKWLWRTVTVQNGGNGLLFVGDDWAEDHHDVEVQDETGRRLGKARLPEGVAGLGRLHALVGEHLGQDSGPQQVAVGIETDRGPWVAAVVAAGYQVYAINPRRGGEGPRPRAPEPGVGADPAGAAAAVGAAGVLPGRPGRLR